MAKRFNTPDCADVYHYVTLNIRERRKPFLHAHFAQLALEELRHECDRHPAELTAFVVMPDHVHFLAKLSDGELSRFLRRYKPGVTLKLDALAATRGNERIRNWLKSKGRRELWQDGKHSLHVTSQEWLSEKILYIHQNPVRAGLVSSAAEYKWSSYGAYVPLSGHVPPAIVDVVEFW